MGGAPCSSYTVDSATQITCVVPAGSVGTVAATVTATSGLGTLANAYRYVAGPVGLVGTAGNGAASLAFTAPTAPAGLLTGYELSVDAGATWTTLATSGASSAVTAQLSGLTNGVTYSVQVRALTASGSTAVSNLASISPIAAPVITSVSPTAGPLGGGGNLVITGTDLTGASAVTVGGTACTSYTVDSPTQITCVLPAGAAGAVDVVVTTAYGSGTLTGAYTYVAPPTITASAPADGLLSGGEALVLTGTDFSGAAAVTVGGVACTSFTVDSPTRITCVVPTASAAGAVDVVVTTAFGSGISAHSYTYRDPASPASPAAPAVPSISQLDPASGPLAGGNRVTVHGAHLELVTFVRIAGQVRPSGSFVVSADGSELAFTIPAGIAAGDVSVSLLYDGGVLTHTYTYVSPAARPAGPVALALHLALAADSKLVGAKARMAGGGLKPRSAYTLTMHSATVTVASGRTDAKGTFAALLTMPGKACVRGGMHRLVLTGTAPDGRAVRDTKWIVLDDQCVVYALLAKQVTTPIDLQSFLFDYRSSSLSQQARASVRDIASTTRGATSVTITGYTQTDLHTAAARQANVALAHRRAAVVAAYLRRLGVHARIIVVARGPVDPVSTRQQRLNRRVEVAVSY